MHTSTEIWLLSAIVGLALATWLVVRLWKRGMIFTSGVKSLHLGHATVEDLETEFTDKYSPENFWTFTKGTDEHGPIGLRLLAECAHHNTALALKLLSHFTNAEIYEYCIGRESSHTKTLLKLIAPELGYGFIEQRHDTMPIWAQQILVIGLNKKFTSLALKTARKINAQNDVKTH
jgi:hypothetical protein